MQEVSKDIFYQAVADFEWIPFTQTLAYNLSLVAEEAMHFYLDDVESPCVGCVGYERRKLGMRMLCVGGECLRAMQVDRKKYAAFYQGLHETGFDVYEVNISTPYSVDAEIAFRTGAWLRPVGMFSTNLSKIISTTSPAKYDRSWKHNLKKAHTSDLSLVIKENFDQEDILAYMACHREILSRKGFRDDLSESGLEKLRGDDHFKMGLVTDREGIIVAGHIFYAHPLAASSIYAFTTLEGREKGAAYLLYEGMIQYLAQQQIKVFDVGRITPSAHKKNNIFLFKDGIGGEYVQYLGEWLWCKRKWMPLALYFMKKYVWKRVQV